MIDLLLLFFGFVLLGIVLGLVGFGLRDAAGNPLFEYMIKVAKNAGNGTVEHMWRNPATNAVESKHTLVQRVGDVMLDQFVYGETTRISPEAPVPVVKVTRSEERPGGAANVARTNATLPGA